MRWINKLPLSWLIIGSLTLGLAPFFPPHLFEKLAMLFAGELSRAIDMLDLLMHAAFPVLLIIKIVVWYRLR